MITIIDYGKTNSDEIAESLAKLSVNYNMSNRESDILKADKLIIPDSEDITSSIKKLHLLNLFSILRIVNKPILGIGTGMHLMTKSLKDNTGACLGCFPVECSTDAQHSREASQSLVVNVIKETELFNNVAEEDRFYFKGNCFIPRNECTTSVVNIDSEITSSIEKNHLYGVQFNPERSSDPGLQILKNFLDI
jgi:glutamine amidotransferase